MPFERSCFNKSFFFSKFCECPSTHTALCVVSRFSERIRKAKTKSRWDTPSPTPVLLLPDTGGRGRGRGRKGPSTLGRGRGNIGRGNEEGVARGRGRNIGPGNEEGVGRGRGKKKRNKKNKRWCVHLLTIIVC